MSDPAPERNDQLPRHQQLIVTILGLYARRLGGCLPVSHLIRLLGDLGAGDAAVRSSVSRLKKRGVLNGVRVSGAAAYALTEKFENVLREGDARIFSPRRATPEDLWLLAAFTVPESQRHLRHRIRSLFTKRGFGSVTPGLWIAPETLFESTWNELQRDDLTQYVDFFRSQTLGEVNLADKVSTWWDLRALERLYLEFIERYEPVHERWSGAAPGDPREAFRDYIPLVTQWRRLPYLDPGLPLEHLPQPWPGQRAEQLFTELHATLGPLASRHADEVLHADPAK